MCMKSTRSVIIQYNVKREMFVNQSNSFYVTPWTYASFLEATFAYTPTSCCCVAPTKITIRAGYSDVGELLTN